MTFLFAVIGVAAIGYLLWRAFGPQSASDDHPGHGGGGVRRAGPVGPDDDPDFLRDLDNRTRGGKGTDSDDA